MIFSVKFLIASLFIVICCWSTTNASIGGYISPSDKKRFVQLLTKALKVEGDDILLPYYGVQGLQLLNEQYDKTRSSQICNHLKNKFKSVDNLEASFNAFKTWSLLNCEGKLHTDALIKDVKAVLENEKSSTVNVRYALEILSLLKIAIPSPAKVVQLLQNRLKEDDSLQNIGHAMHAAAFLGDAGKFAQDRIEDVVVQADEVDGRLLQWEGGLTTTSLLITGLLQLPGANPFTSQQAEKLANYLLTRTTVQTPKGIASLLEASQALASSKVSPVSISVIGPGHVTVEKPELKVQISNLFGQPLKPALSPVVAQSVKRVSDDKEVLSKQTLTTGSSPIEYILKLNSLETGIYKVTLNADSHKATLSVRVLGPVNVNSLDIGLGDADGSSIPKLSKLTYPAKLSSKLQADSSQQLVVKFSISRPVHQAFVRLFTDKKEIIFVAEQDSSKVYKVEVNLVSELGKSGTFDIELILGDAVITNPVRWVLGSIEVNLGVTEPLVSLKVIRGPKPEIKHLFRPAEKRPAEVVSLFFSGLTALPFLILLILWAKLGINFGNFSASALPFHLGLGAILGLFTLFWLKLDMFVTCAWLIPIGSFTFLSGHKLLSQIASNRVKKQEKADK